MIRGFLGLYDLSKEELLQIPGIGKVKADTVKMYCRTEQADQPSFLTGGGNLECAESVANYYMEQLRHETKEVLLVSLFTGKGRLITEQVVSVGSINSSVVSPREIFYTAIIHNAAYLILLHNHPSGDPTPSEQDFKVTEHLKICGKYMDIQLADHIIIGDNQYYSFRENGRL